MSYKPTSLFRMIEAINHSVYLPHIQRPFVWDQTQMTRLFDSLMQNFPIQTFLFWRTRDAIKARKFMKTVDWDADLHDLYEEGKSAEGVDKVFVLDGQQRLQSLYSLFNGSVRHPDGKKELDAYFNPRSGGAPVDSETLTYEIKFADESPGVGYYRLRDLLEKDAQKNPGILADDFNDKLDAALTEESTEDRRKRQRLVRENFHQVNTLLRDDKHFWVQELDGVADKFPYKKVLDIFVRVNSGGTKLDSADLMFAAMKEGWSEIEENVEDVVELLNGEKLGFDKSFVLKCLVVAHGKGVELTPQKFSSTGDDALLKIVEKDWQKAETAFQQLRDIIEQDIQIYSSKVIRSHVSFIPLFDFLFHNPTPNESNRQLIRAYYYKSQIFGWYRAYTDSVLNALHPIVGKDLKGEFPLTDIKNYFVQQGRDVELSATHLNNNRIRQIMLNLIYVERFGKSPFNVRYKGNEPHIDHIYPKATLKKRFGLGSEEIDGLGNLRYVGATDNIRKRAESPGSYFTKLKAANVNIENHLILKDFASAPELLELDLTVFRNFRDRRFQEVFKIADGVVNAERKAQA